MIYSIDDSNVYRRGPLYPLLLAPPVLIMAVNVIALWRRRKKLSSKQRLAFGIYIIIPMISMLLQMFFYGIYMILLGSSVAAVFMFNYIWLDQSERYYQQVRENEQLRIDIMLSLIQPHFLYNTLGAIQSLCKTDSVAAEKAVAQFSRYLRGNMDSITKDRTVSFTQELEHTKLYLELEQLRYEDALQVSYDLNCTEFRIPTLTLQPLAENAVRHGVRGKPSGRGTVAISSQEYEDHYEITVEDDGPGFDPNQEKCDGQSHIGLANVRERLQRVAGGSLRIDSAPGVGTKAVIMIPKEGV
ncbi:MAG: histidine kinase [Oscillospiraceae bacterium]|nr:histidine kinase [Oscillospiraceae bacterium]